MSTGGYKCVKFSWQGGRSDTPVDRVKFILNGVCDAIIGANVGWQLDTLTPTSSDFLTMPSYGAPNFPNMVKVLKLEYNSHIYRLGIGYLYYRETTFPIKPSDTICTKNGNEGCIQNGKFNGGLYIGMIRDGTFVTDATYNYVWDGNGVFLRWSPFSMSFQSGSATFASQNTVNSLYSFYFLLKNAQVVAFERSSSWTNNCRLKGMVLGEIFKETGHASDTYTMGCCALNAPGSSDSEIGELSNGYLINSTNGYGLINISSSVYQGAQVIAADGTSYYGKYAPSNNTAYVSTVGLDTTVATDVISSVLTSPGGRWTPVYMYINAADHDTYGVVPGDGFKGYIDTDLLRGVNPNYSYGQQLQGGDFVYLGGGFAIGWDADNEILLF